MTIRKRRRASTRRAATTRKEKFSFVQFVRHHRIVLESEGTRRPREGSVKTAGPKPLSFAHRVTRKSKVIPVVAIPPNPLTHAEAPLLRKPVANATVNPTYTIMSTETSNHPPHRELRPLNRATSPSQLSTR